MKRDHRFSRFSLLLALLFASPALAQDGDADGHRLTIRVLGLESSKGSVAVALFDSETRFESRRDPVASAFVPIRGASCEWTVDSIPPGEYVAALYHDRNGNRKLDKTAFGMPKEPYGFSNNARAKFGPPAFDRAKLRVDSDRVVEVEVR
jgi:uncharacterized protein (DUF2141 family)